jgi:hypothetical protein
MVTLLPSRTAAQLVERRDGGCYLVRLHARLTPEARVAADLKLTNDIGWLGWHGRTHAQ